jgi:carboxylesterase
MTTELSGCEPLSADGGDNGVLVLHGFTGCPQSMRGVAEAFAAAGHTVEMPLLPGHGTTVDDLIATGWSDWSGAAEQAYTDLAARCSRVVVAGLSMGGALTLWLAGRHPEIAGIVCVNPVVDVGPDIVGVARDMIAGGTDRIPAIGGDIADPGGHEAAYDAAPLAPLLSLAEGTDALRADLGHVTSPLLLLNSPQDHVVPPANAETVASGVAGPVERVTLERSYHVATLDYDAGLIQTEAVAFAARCFAG